MVIAECHTTGRKPNRLITLQIGNKANDQIVCLAYRALAGERDNMIVVLKLIVSLAKTNSLGVEVKRLTDSSKEKLAEARTTFISVDKVRTLVKMGELVRYKEAHEMVFRTFDKKYTEAYVIEGEEVLTVRPEENEDTEILCKHTDKTPRGNGDRR